MQRLPSVSRAFIAAALIAFGIQHLVYGDFVTRIVPKLPAWIPAHSACADAFGVALIACALVFVFLRKLGRPVAVALGATVLLSALFLYLPRLLGDIRNGGLWTQSLKGFAFSGTLFALAASFGTRETSNDVAPSASIFPTNALLTLLARIFFAAFLIVAGVQHFIYDGFVDTLVPAWIPAARFWTYFSALALLAGGAGLLLERTLRPAALLTGAMIFTWVLLLHLPRALQIGDANETTAVFEALAFSGLAFLLASTATTPAVRNTPAERGDLRNAESTRQPLTP